VSREAHAERIKRLQEAMIRMHEADALIGEVRNAAQPGSSGDHLLFKTQEAILSAQSSLYQFGIALPQSDEQQG
jgi:hypothetical protein